MQLGIDCKQPDMRLSIKAIAYLTIIWATTLMQAAAQETTTAGRDFWVALLVNGSEQMPFYTKITAFGDTACSVTVSNPNTGWSQAVWLNAHNSVTVNLPNNAVPENYSLTEEKGFHVTSTANIQLVATFTRLASTGVAGILPTRVLGDRYIVLDYPADPSRSDISGATVTIVATQPNTTIQYTPPCTLYHSPVSVVGTTVTHTFNAAGETLTLMANTPNASLSGMEITSDKPIALFQGNQITGVPYTTPSGDHMYEQALPVSQWGKSYALVPTIGRTVGDRVRVVADSACSVSLSTGSSFTLTEHGVHEFDIGADSPCILNADKPVCVGLCAKGSDWNAEPGDASLLMVPPLERGISRAMFATISTERITNTWHLAVVTASPGTMNLDGNSIASQFSPIGATGYSYARISVSNGTHTLDNSQGTFAAWTYGKGNVDGYLYQLGQTVDIYHEFTIYRDTVEYSDTICQGGTYDEHGFHVDTAETLMPCTVTITDSVETDPGHITYKTLTLTVLATAIGDTTLAFVLGDTVFFLGDTLTSAGDYLFTLTTANGCDSLLTLHLGYETIRMTYSDDNICSGEGVTLTAEGLKLFRWRSRPPDATLTDLQGQNPIIVYPTETTVYSLLDPSGNAIDSVTVHVEAFLPQCIESNRDFIDFDFPVLVLTDCTGSPNTSTWTFSDGYVIRGERARRQFQYPLPDTITVTLSTCTPHGCCTDTTIGFHTEIRSVWFPNIFAPNWEQNNRFGCITSCQVQKFELSIYNRWGLIVWHSDNVHTQWDGTHAGMPVPQGAYVYVWYLEDIHGNSWNGNGTVTLIR